MDAHQPSSKSIYDASTGEVAGKNFVAGLAHGLGGLIVTLISWVLLYVLFTNFILPQISGTLKQAESLMKMVESLNKTQSQMETLTEPSSGGTRQIIVPENLIRQFQQTQPQE